MTSEKCFACSNGKDENGYACQFCHGSGWILNQGIPKGKSKCKEQEKFTNEKIQDVTLK